MSNVETFLVQHERNVHNVFIKHAINSKHFVNTNTREAVHVCANYIRLKMQTLLNKKTSILFPRKLPLKRDEGRNVNMTEPRYVCATVRSCPQVK